VLATSLADGASDGIEVPTSAVGELLPSAATERKPQSGSLGRSEASTELNAADAVSAAESALAGQTERAAGGAADATGSGDPSMGAVASNVGSAGSTSGAENLLASAAASQPALDATAPETNPTRVASAATLPAEVADSVRVATFRGDSDIRLVLNPPELGHLDIHISRGEHGLRIVMEASEAGARELLDRSMTGLHQALEARDLRVDRLEVRGTDTGRGSLDTSAGGEQSGGGAFSGSQGEETPEWSPVAMFEATNESMDRPATEPEPTSDGGASDGIAGSVDVLA
jgi:flagellar hook-length control protein FliK